MHEAFNTRGGQFGFIVATTEGKVYREDAVTWDEIPRDAKIVGLKIVHLPTSHVYVNLTGYGRYFFGNEAVTARTSGFARHSAKVFGGCNGDKAMFVKLGFDGILPQFLQREEVSVASLGMSDHAFRQGV